MESVFYCKKCCIDFPSATSYVKHRRSFCNIGQQPLGNDDENVSPKDGIGKLPIEVASKRIQDVITEKIKTIDPFVYNKVDEINQYKKHCKSRAAKLISQRQVLLNAINSYKREKKDLENSLLIKIRQYESYKAYQMLSNYQEENNDYILEEIETLKKSIVFLSDKIDSRITDLDILETHGYLEEVEIRNVRSSENFYTSKSTRSSSTHALVPTPRATATFRHARSLDNTSELRRDEEDLDSVGYSSVVSSQVLSKLQKKYEMLRLEKEIKEIQSTETDVLTLINEGMKEYATNVGFNIYIDYVIPAYQITTQLKICLFRNEEKVRDDIRYIVSAVDHVMFLGYHVTFKEVSPSDNTYLVLYVQSMQNELLGWCVFSLFTERLLNAGVWKTPLKVPPFHPHYVSSLYHKVHTQNSSIRIRICPSSLHEAIMKCGKLDVSYYKPHNPIFFDSRLSVQHSDGGRKSGAVSTVFKRKKITPVNPSVHSPSVATATPTPSTAPCKKPSTVSKLISEISSRINTHKENSDVAKEQPKVKGLHLQALKANSKGPIEAFIGLCLFDGEYNITTSSKGGSVGRTATTTLINYFLFDDTTLELPWGDNDAVVVFSFLDVKTKTPMCWSFARYSERTETLNAYSPPLLPFPEILKELRRVEDTSQNTALNSKLFKVIPDAKLHLRYYDTPNDDVSRFLGTLTPPPDFSVPRVPTGSFRHRNMRPSSELHNRAVSFTVAIDGARHLPSTVTISRVVGRVLDKDYNNIGPQISTGLVVDSDIYNPIYKYSVQIPGDIPPTCIAVLKVYTIHSETGKLVNVGYSILNMFNKKDTVEPAEEGELEVSLNKGDHQIPLYLRGPDTASPLQMSSLDYVLKVPCARLLVRIIPGTGTVTTIPYYNDGTYIDTSPQLASSEAFVMESYGQRRVVAGTSVMNRDESEIEIKSVKLNVIKQLTRYMGQNVSDITLSDIMPYNSNYGFGVKVVGLKKLSGRGKPYVYLRLVTIETLRNFNCSIAYNKAIKFMKVEDELTKVRFEDDIHYFTQVYPAQNVVIIVHVVIDEDCEFRHEGWFLVPIFYLTSKETKYIHSAFGVNRRWNIPLINKAINFDSKLLDEEPSTDLSGYNGSYGVIEILDSRYAMEISNLDEKYPLNEEYVSRAKEGVDFLASYLSLPAPE